MRNFENEFETKNRKTGTVTAIVITVVVLLLLAAAFFAARFVWQANQAPDVSDNKVLFSDATGVVNRDEVVTLPPEVVYGSTSMVVDTDGSTRYVYTDTNGVTQFVPDSTEPPKAPERREGVYTFLIAGLDDSKAHADVVMVATYDTVGQTLNIMSIPRDTYSVANDRAGYLKHLTLSYQSGGIDALVYEVYNIIGFYPDYYVTVDWNGFISIINYVGGVYFNVPMDMDGDSGVIKAGYQWLSGSQALDVCRFRSGYADADIGRIRTRDAFIKATASQILSGATVFRSAEIAGAVYDNVHTDISKTDLAWFAKNAVELSTDNITFVTFPGGPAWDSGMWIPYPQELLNTVNEYLNPYQSDIVTINIVQRSENYGK
ncbi:MAG: LCP family protein [Clostridia bacterium]|nr:LCP family protein [Clostridia bacterium]